MTEPSPSPRTSPTAAIKVSPSGTRVAPIGISTMSPEKKNDTTSPDSVNIVVDEKASEKASPIIPTPPGAVSSSAMSVGKHDEKEVAVHHTSVGCCCGCNKECIPGESAIILWYLGSIGLLLLTTVGATQMWQNSYVHEKVSSAVDIPVQLTGVSLYQYKIYVDIRASTATAKNVLCQNKLFYNAYDEPDSCDYPASSKCKKIYNEIAFEKFKSINVGTNVTAKYSIRGLNDEFACDTIFFHESDLSFYASFNSRVAIILLVVGTTLVSIILISAIGGYIRELYNIDCCCRPILPPTPPPHEPRMREIKAVDEIITFSKIKGIFDIFNKRTMDAIKEIGDINHSLRNIYDTLGLHAVSLHAGSVMHSSNTHVQLDLITSVKNILIQLIKPLYFEENRLPEDERRLVFDDIANRVHFAEIALKPKKVELRSGLVTEN